MVEVKLPNDGPNKQRRYRCRFGYHFQHSGWTRDFDHCSVDVVDWCLQDIVDLCCWEDMVDWWSCWADIVDDIHHQAVEYSKPDQEEGLKVLLYTHYGCSHLHRVVEVGLMLVEWRLERPRKNKIYF